MKTIVEGVELSALIASSLSAQCYVGDAANQEEGVALDARHTGQLYCL
jgi:hypothetical protein